jgi:hypothetical protein
MCAVQSVHRSESTHVCQESGTVCLLYNISAFIRGQLIYLAFLELQNKRTIKNCDTLKSYDVELIDICI